MRRGEERYEITIQLDCYDDLFSDFDPRSYIVRALSDDFLFELRKGSLAKSQEIDLHFFLHGKKRDPKLEAAIKKRLLNHFRRHTDLVQKEIQKVRRMGYLFTVIGIVSMFITTIILFRLKESLFASFGIILLEPASWFLFWEGLNLIIFTSKKYDPDFTFYKKMLRSRIFFSSKS